MPASGAVDNTYWRERSNQPASHPHRKKPFSQSYESSLEETTVGTNVSSFDELLARELRKDSPPPTSTSHSKPTSTSKAQPKKFLKKGSRGWWMKAPGASKRMPKHTLTSKDDQDDENQTQSPSSLSRNYQKQSSPPDSPQNQYEVDDWVQADGYDMALEPIEESFEAERARKAAEIAEFEQIEAQLASERHSFYQSQTSHEDEEWKESDGYPKKAWEENQTYLDENYPGDSSYDPFQLQQSLSFLQSAFSASSAEEKDELASKSSFLSASNGMFESKRQAPSELSVYSVDEDASWSDPVVNESSNFYDTQMEESQVSETEAPVSNLVSTIFQHEHEPQEDNIEVQSPASSKKRPLSHTSATKTPPSKTKSSPSVQKSQERLALPPSNQEEDTILPTVIEEKLMELEEEVKFYRSATLQLQKQKQAYEQERKKLVQEKKDFESWKQTQMQVVEKEKEKKEAQMKNEMRRLDRIAKLKTKGAEGRSTELEALKAQLVSKDAEQAEIKRKSKASLDALRKRISDLESRNQELQDEVNYLEQDRLERWKASADESNSRHPKPKDSDTDTFDLSGIRASAEELLKLSNASQQQNDPSYDPLRYQNKSHVESQEVTEEVERKDGRKETFYADGSRQVTFPDGNVKHVDADGSVTITFANGDEKREDPKAGTSVYWYSEAQTKVTTHADGSKLYEFGSGQKEQVDADGKTQIWFPDGVHKTIEKDGVEVARLPDGMVLKEFPSGYREVLLPGGKHRIKYATDGGTRLVNEEKGEEVVVRSETHLKALLAAGA